VVEHHSLLTISKQQNEGEERRRRGEEWNKTCRNVLMSE
jgi:hypothetical protein